MGARGNSTEAITVGANVIGAFVVLSSRGAMRAKSLSLQRLWAKSSCCWVLGVRVVLYETSSGKVTISLGQTHNP